MNNFWEIGCEEIYNEQGDVVLATASSGDEIPFDEWAEQPTKLFEKYFKKQLTPTDIYDILIM